MSEQKCSVILFDVRTDVPQISIVAPVFNEADAIQSVIQDWIKVLDAGVSQSIWKTYEIVVCEDGSTDETPEILANLARSNRNLKVIRNEWNLGAGASLSRAISASRGTHIALMDSDGQFESDQLIEMYKKLSHYDAVCGIRSKNSSLAHNLASKLSTKFANCVLRSNVKDFNCQLKIMPGDLLRAYKLRATRMNYSGEITYLVVTSKLKTLWFEIEHRERVSGKSNTKIVKDGFSRLLFILYLGFENKLSRMDILNLESELRGDQI
jgi:dolichol-phosphate mannosyltransferase